MIQRIVDSLGSLGPHQLALGLAVMSALLIVEDRRLSIGSLMAQYILLSLVLSRQLYRPISFIRFGLGFAVCLVLYITAIHVQSELSAKPPQEGTSSTSLLPILTTRLVHGGTFFRLVVMLLGGLVAYSVWRSRPLGLIPAELNLVSYWLIAIGSSLMLTSVDPLRTGFGLLTFVNGFEGTYLFLEPSLLVIALLGIVDIFMALAIAVCSEAWLESQKGKGSEQ